jgi:ATP-dependent DNA helicase RecG
MEDMSPLTVTTAIERVPGVGPALKTRFHQLGIRTAGDLLFHFPSRYEDLSHVTPIHSLMTGMTQTVRGIITHLQNKRSPRRRTTMTEAIIEDRTDSIHVIWFGQPFITKNLRVGDEVFLSGKVEENRYGRSMMSPIYEKVREEQRHTARIVPIYPSTRGLTQKQIRYILSLILPMIARIQEWMPEKILQEVDLFEIPIALHDIHFPKTMNAAEHARRRLQFDELFFIHLHALRAKHDLQQQRATPIPFHEADIRAFVQSLPFTLTRTQKRSAWEILKDCERQRPMNRLLEGDVGSGKTVVAAIATLNAARSELQSSLMAPTEILAIQHERTMTELFSAHRVRTALLTHHHARVTIQHRKEDIRPSVLKQMIQEGQVDLVIGTHAMIQEDVRFYNLGIAIIDEQHRFGVEQRRMIKEKSGDRATTPHLLSMTATPIPRSLALTLYGDLDLSMIEELPKNRKPILTKVVDPANRAKADEFIRERLARGQQAFVVCPLIEESDVLGVKSATEEYERLSREVFPEFRVGLLHGKLKADQKDRVMQEFQEKKIAILVTTAVVEVGIDIPNATMMLIEGAQRFGLAQLHQFRGRVGRCDKQSFCFLFSESPSPEVHERLEKVATCRDGFELAEYDLKRRGPGEVYGTEQSGLPEFKIATLQDAALVRAARTQSEGIMHEDPTFSRFPLLSKRVQGFERQIHLE